MLYRLSYRYPKLGEAAITFWAADLIDAEAFRTRWLKRTGTQEIELIALGRSCFEPRTIYHRRKEPSGLTQEEAFQLEIKELG